MTETWLETIHRLGTPLKVKKNAYIYDAANPYSSPYAYFLEKGVCALSGFLKNGGEKIFLYFTPQRMVGFSQLMIENYETENYYIEFSIIAKTNCSLYRIPKKLFHSLLKEDPAFNQFMLDILSQNYCDILNRFHQIQEESVTTRLCRFLLIHSEKTNGRLLLPRHFTYVEMSRYLGVHPVTVARIMAKLKQSGYIAKTDQLVTVENIKQMEILIRSGSDMEY